MTLVPSAYAEGHMVLETDHFSEYVIVYEGDEELADVTEETDTEGTDTTENVTEEVQEEKGGSPTELQKLKASTKQFHLPQGPGLLGSRGSVGEGGVFLCTSWC